jgi:hypothetical protein
VLIEEVKLLMPQKDWLLVLFGEVLVLKWME